MFIIAQKYKQLFDKTKNLNILNRTKVIVFVRSPYIIIRRRSI